MRLEKNAKRLVIFFFYDEGYIVDDYIGVLLEGLRKSVNDYFIVTNGYLPRPEHDKFLKFTDRILMRENVGFDVWAYKDALEYIGWDKLIQYDEVILMNYTIFGPLYPFEEMFETMNSRDLDFWGITKHHKVDFDCFGTCKYGYIPEHIQSSFLVIRNSLLRSSDYQDMWKNMPMIHSYGESVGLYEAIFTKEFNEKGYKSDVYINTDDLEGYTKYPLMMMAYELIKNRRCPILKVKNFSQNYYDILGDTVGNVTRDTLEYIKNSLTYDSELIYQHIIRTSNLSDLKNTLHLNYVLPKRYAYSEPKGKKIAIMMHLYYADLVEYCIEYAKNVPEGTDLIITTPKQEIISKVKKMKLGKYFKTVKVIKIENVGRDVSALLVGCRPYIYNYDYVCFVHDKKTTQIKPYCNGEGFAYKCWENNLGSKEYVKNIIATFESDSHLGLLTPPPPNHGQFYQIIGSEWASNYTNTISLAYQLKLNCKIDGNKPPIAPLGTMFWFRPKALKTLFDYGWEYKDFPKEPNYYDGTLLHAIERIYGFVPQHEGYYVGWVMTDDYASLEQTNLHFMLREINLKLFKKYYTTNLLDMTQKIDNNMQMVWEDNITFMKRIKLFAKKVLPFPVYEAMRKQYAKYLFWKEKRIMKRRGTA
ncbi:MAG: rhamnan synthesis F family protein [Lachnospiraceae bacterium]|nr:rhamnan synthesis F family protein [Lachnospiraceae bacterium]